MQAGGGEMYFDYGETEVQYLRSRDKRIGEVIDRVGMIRREVEAELFAAVVHQLAGGLHHGLCPPSSERSLRPGNGAGEQRCGGHPAAVYPEGRGGVDGGDDPAVLPAKTGYFQL